MINLLKETVDVLAARGYTLNDITIVCNDGIISKETFIKLADREYDDGYGCEEVRTDLMLIGSDFWFERAEYDGSEWWTYHKKPTIDDLKPISEVELFYDSTWK